MVEHVAIIMDGAARWAAEKGLEESRGWVAGIKAAEVVAGAAAVAGVTNLTLYPVEEGARLPLLEALAGWVSTGLRIRYTGRGTLPEADLARLEEAERSTHAREGMCLNLALDYDGRTEIVDAASAVAREIEEGRLKPEEADEAQLARHLYRPDIPDIDLLVRTGGEDHLAGFMLWQTAYAEIVFTRTLWPDFTRDDLSAAIAEFGRRVRKFGAVNNIQLA